MSDLEQIEKWRTLFRPNLWSEAFQTWKPENLYDAKVPSDWTFPSYSGTTIDLTEMIDSLVTGQDQSKWLETQLEKIGVVRSVVEKTTQLFQQSNKTPTWTRAREIYNLYLARYEGLWRLSHQSSVDGGSKRKKPKKSRSGSKK